MFLLHTVNSEGFTTFWCPFCGGVSHPACGSELRPGYVVCGRCTREARAWMHGMMGRGSKVHGSKQRVLFYEALARWDVGDGLLGVPFRGMERKNARPPG